MAHSRGTNTFGLVVLAAMTAGAGAALGYFVLGGTHASHPETDAPGVQEASVPPEPAPVPTPPARPLVHVHPNSDYTAPGAPHIHIVEDPSATLDSPKPTRHTARPTDVTQTTDIPTPDVEASQEGDGGAGTVPPTSGTTASPGADAPPATPATTPPPATPDSEATQTGTTAPPTAPPSSPSPDPEASQTGTPPAAASTGARAQYRIQAGSFGSSQDAQNYVNTLQGKGVDASVSPQRQGGQTVYKVQVGAYHDRNAAEQAASDFRRQGVPVTVAPITP